MPQSRRLPSIDAFRAITMLLMIFVNDLWSLKNIPAWLEHAGKLEDRLGFADIIFPAFLFIVGLSIPFAIRAREKKGASRADTMRHILKRSLALLVMGIFHVNLESYNKAAAILPKPCWQIGITIAFFLIWLDFSPKMTITRRRAFQAGGVLLLATLAVLYRGGTPDDPIWMRPHWYGILGLIGWCYLLCATIYLFTSSLTSSFTSSAKDGQGGPGDRLAPVAGALVLFLAMSIADQAGWLDALDPVRDWVWIVGSGSLPAITMGGVLVAMIYRRMIEMEKKDRAVVWLAGIAIITLVAGLAVRALGGISKIRATPAWVLICMAISVATFAMLAFVMDIGGRTKWANPIRPGGTSTLTAYLLPYIHYAIYNFFGKSAALPLVLRTGAVGIVKSLLYAFLIILITGWLEKRRLRLCI